MGSAIGVTGQAPGRCLLRRHAAQPELAVTLVGDPRVVASGVTIILTTQ